ncbi:MAG: NADH-quinone oxidoreductase subunit C [Methanomassiliicoccales archaeon]|nr:NADH-quinone oxidoreductase subunit C [Methanomassiliicoccales archaeon]
MTENRLADIVGSMSPEVSAAILTSSVRQEEIWMEVDTDHLKGVAAHIHNLWGADLVTMHAVDNRARTKDYKIVVVLSLNGEAETVTLLASIASDSPRYASLTPDIPSASWFEREIRDMFGIEPVGHPELRPFVLYDDWPADVHPLRKDFDASTKIPRVPNPYPFRRVEGEGVFEIPVGPVHAGVIEPGHFRFSVSGEPIIALEVRLGYTHKGTEKLSESMPYARGVDLAERISGDNSFAHSLAYCQTVEKLASIEAPERALCLRTAFAEMERIYNHLGDLGGIALDTGFSIPAQHAFILRERMLDLNDRLTGSRLLRSTNRVGGVWKDVGREAAQRVAGQLVRLELEFDDFVDMLESSPSFFDRIETTGAVTLDQARLLGLVGPAARASGYDRDVRRDRPYAAYARLSFRVPVQREGDVRARMQVKIDELRDSLSLVKQALQDAPEGELSVEVGDVPEGRTAFSLVESPRGELVHWIISGPEGRPFRHKVVDPSFRNWPAMEVAVLGNIVPDFPLINKSFNLSYSGSDL